MISSQKVTLIKLNHRVQKTKQTQVLSHLKISHNFSNCLTNMLKESQNKTPSAVLEAVLAQKRSNSNPKLQKPKNQQFSKYL